MKVIKRDGTIESFDEAIEVTSDGTMVFCEGKSLSISKTSHGYMQVNVKGKNLKVHRLVAERYVPNPHGYKEVNHKDEDKTNNHYTNLEWCTRQYNQEYSMSKTYKLIDPSGEVREVFNMRKFCRDNKLDLSTMFKVMRGQRKHHKGWKFL